MIKKRKICVVTGSRAEYGLLRPLLQEIKACPDLELQVVATGMHLSQEFGLTYREIEGDGFNIDEKVEMLSSSDSPAGIAGSMGTAMNGFADVYQRLRPDIMVVLGDRYEILSAVCVALVHRIPVAHLSGGEVTEGAFDDAIRHSISKMSHLHFTFTDQYRKRVIQLGESPDRVFNVGSIALDSINKLPLLSKKELEKELGFEFEKRNLMVTFHPVTLENNAAQDHFQNLLEVLSRRADTRIIFTKANADTGGRAINKMIDRFVSDNAEKAVAFISLGQLNYLSMMRFVDAVVGNSSSGIVEAPSFKIGTINVGDRQKGRIRTESIIDCDADKQSLEKAFKKLYSREFQKMLKGVTNPFGDGKSAVRIAAILKNYDLSNIVKKRFHNIDFMIKGDAK
ncbi:MAG: UDP-N-acetylglucosamine 2-epimerase [Pseudomonadota bacterium]